MKYVWILIVIIFVARIDMFLSVFEDLAGKMRFPKSNTSDSTDFKPSEILVPLGQDRTLTQTSKSKFLLLLDEFHSNPRAEVRSAAVTILKRNPVLFSEKLDKELESALFPLRDLIYQRDEQLPLLLAALSDILEGENLSIIKRLFSVMMDSNMHEFLAAYALTKDTNCMIASFIGDDVSEDTKVSIYQSRESSLKQFLEREKLDPRLKTLAENCLLVLNYYRSQSTGSP